MKMPSLTTVLAYTVAAIVWFCLLDLAFYFIDAKSNLAYVGFVLVAALVWVAIWAVIHTIKSFSKE